MCLALCDAYRQGARIATPGGWKNAKTRPWTRIFLSHSARSGPRRGRCKTTRRRHRRNPRGRTIGRPDEATGMMPTAARRENDDRYWFSDARRPAANAGSMGNRNGRHERNGAPGRGRWNGPRRDVRAPLLHPSRQHLRFSPTGRPAPIARGIRSAPAITLGMAAPGHPACAGTPALALTPRGVFPVSVVPGPGRRPTSPSPRPASRAPARSAAGGSSSRSGRPRPRRR